MEPTVHSPFVVPPQKTAEAAPKPQETPLKPTEKSTDDIIKQVGAMKAEQKSEAQEPVLPPINLDEIKDPVARAFVEKRIKELESGVNKKFIDAADKRKEAERLKAEYESKLNEPFTPQRVQELLKRPDFIQAAQMVQQSAPPTNFDGSVDQWSNLSDQEKQRIVNAETLARQTQSQLNQIMMLQIDQRIQSRFPDYDSRTVDSFLKDAYEGRITDEQLREMVHKAQNFERYVSNAYKYRQEDNGQLNTERANGMTTTGLETRTAEDKPKMKPGERSGDFFKRLSNWNLRNISAQPTRKQT